MTKLEKVIKGLECCRRGFCFACPYNDEIDENTDCKQRWADDALALLKAQEPRLLTLEEMKAVSDKAKPVCVETPDGVLRWALTHPGIEPPKEGFNYPGGVLFNAVDVNDEVYDGDFYCMTMPDGRPHHLAWRAWTSEPTEAEREATPWE